MMRFTYLVVLLIVTTSIIKAQNIIVLSGKVVDKADNTPIIGATIIESDQDNRVINGTITNVDGNFILQLMDSKHNVSVSYIGYKPYTIQSFSDNNILIKLELQITDLEEVVVTAKQGTSNSLINVEERDIATSTVKVELDDIQGVGVTSVADALQGKVTGLDIISGSGDPGSGSQFVIRGLSSMGNNQPLIVIDGIPQQQVSQDFDLASANTEDIANMINISLQDIKSIEVYKDAASSAIYGSKGADGVLLIETFRGRMGKVEFDYQYKNSINFQPPPIPMLNGDEYSILQIEEWHNAYGVFDLPFEISYDRNYDDFYNYSANTDWVGLLTQNSVTHDHYFKIAGGSAKTRYFTSFGYIDENGTTINTGSERFSTRINLDYFLSTKLVFSVQFNYINSNIDRNYTMPGNNRRINVREMAYIKAPNMSVFEYDKRGNLTGNYFTPINSYQGSGRNYWNPIAVAELGMSNEDFNSFENAFNLRFKILDWLTFRETISYQYRGAKKSEFLPYNALGQDWLDDLVNRSTEINQVNSTLNTESQLAFDVPLDNRNHLFSGALNWITRSISSESMQVQSKLTPSTDIIDPSAVAHIQWMGNSETNKRELGALLNLNYKYRDKYMIQGILRTDAASVFGSANRWGLFYGISGAWRFTEEEFFKQINWLDESKLRISYGVAGRQPNDAYSRFATYETSGGGLYIDDNAIIPSQIQLNLLQWETISSYDIGLELNLLKNKLFLEMDYYRKVTENILFKDYDIPLSSGFDKLKFFNGGEMLNKGYELLLDGKVLSKKNFTWSLNFNASRNVNSFSKLPDNFNTEQDLSIGNGEYPKKVVEGEPIGSFFGFRYLGVWASDEDVVALNEHGEVIKDAEGNPIPLTYAGTYIFKGGDAIYEDRNYDGIIDLNDVVYLGNSSPLYVGGFGTFIRYKSLVFSSTFNYRLGFDIVNRVAINTQGMNDRNNQSTAVLNRWRTAGQAEEGLLPRAFIDHPANNLGSSRYVEKGDFLRLSHVRLGFQLPKRIIDNWGIRSSEITISARKLLTFTNYTGQDPEVGQNASNPFWIGEDDAKTPPPRIMTVSVSIGF